MKKKYKHPSIEILQTDSIAILSSSSDLNISNVQGCSPEDPAELKKLLPFICTYNDLENDIKINLKKGEKFTYNFRTIVFYNIPFDVIVCTQHYEDQYCCDYTFIPKHGSFFLIYYNIYNQLEFILRQIREKRNGIYFYHFSKEIKDKIPTLVKLFDNLELAKKGRCGMPYIDFLDEEAKYPLLAIGIKQNEINSPDDTSKFHIALYKILIQLTEECNKAGFLDQSKKQLVNNLMKILLMAHRLN